jgi:hypothetical protein
MYEEAKQAGLYHEGLINPIILMIVAIVTFHSEDTVLTSKILNRYLDAYLWSEKRNSATIQIIQFHQK